mmetsp:Transcript_25939/g.78170  ORF Transcript_25939/g.78170 Transcript_25939/m.78170 type:complete len:83 (+) Transcript_25939:1682-1930(+)
MKMKMIWITKFWKHDMYPSGLLGVNAVTVAHVRIEQHLNSTAARWQRRRNPRRVKSIREMRPGFGLNPRASGAARRLRQNKK